MKRTLISLIAILCVSLTASAAQKRILVSTAEEFINALGSNREIVVINEEGLLLTPAIQNMADRGKLKKFDRWSRARQEGVMYEPDTDGPQLIIAGFKNLTICGNSPERERIEVTPRYVNVLTFISCEDIALEDLYLGHTDEGYCSNGVVGFDDCHNVRIKNCGLFGCGTEGIELRQSSEFTMTDSEIFHCSYYIMHLFGSKNCTFQNCAFYNNKEFEQVSVDADCENVLYDHCVFTGNEGTLFNFYNNRNVLLRRCIIQHAGEMGNGLESFENCIFVN